MEKPDKVEKQNKRKTESARNIQHKKAAAAIVKSSSSEAMKSQQKRNHPETKRKIESTIEFVARKS